MGTPLLAVEHVSVHFQGDDGPIPVLDDISFALDAGETLGIVGESGSGKSMLALTIIGLLPQVARVRSGRIVLAGRDLLELSQRRLDGVRGNELALVYQDPLAALNPTRRIGSQLVEAIRPHHAGSRADARRRAVELLEEVQISHATQRMHAYPHELSGGMCQRVTIAMAIARRPKLLIADEPTTALDATNEGQILELLSLMRAAYGIAMIVISHDIRIIDNFAERVAIMYAGEFVETGATNAVLHDPQHPYTEALLDSIPRPDAPDARHRRLRAIPGAPPRLGAWGPACRFFERCRFQSDDACATEHLGLREVKPGHWVRSAHPRCERVGMAPQSHV